VTDVAIQLSLKPQLPIKKVHGDKVTTSLRVPPHRISQETFAMTRVFQLIFVVCIIATIMALPHFSILQTNTWFNEACGIRKHISSNLREYERPSKLLDQLPTAIQNFPFTPNVSLLVPLKHRKP